MKFYFHLHSDKYVQEVAEYARRQIERRPNRVRKWQPVIQQAEAELLARRLRGEKWVEAWTGETCIAHHE